MTTIMLALTWVINYVRLHKRRVAILAAIVLIALLAILFGRGCNSRRVVLNEKELQEVRQAIETKERQKMEEAFVKVEAKQAEIEANVSNSKAAVVNAQYEAKRRVRELSDEELAEYLESLK